MKFVGLIFVRLNKWKTEIKQIPFFMDNNHFVKVGRCFFTLFLFLFLGGSKQKQENRYLFFLHNRFLEEHGLNEEHPQYGRTEYKEIVSEFERNGFVVISEIRKGNVNARDYAEGVLEQIDSLIQRGVSPKNITVVGTSKGGYIAQYVSTLANNTNLNFVFVASFQESDLVNIPDINYCGNILSIYDRSDPFGVSPIKRRENSTCEISHYGEVELDIKIGDGFLFKPLKDWLEPTMMWANGNFNLEKENLNSIY